MLNQISFMSLKTRKLQIKKKTRNRNRNRTIPNDLHSFHPSFFFLHVITLFSVFENKTLDQTFLFIGLTNIFFITVLSKGLNR